MPTLPVTLPARGSHARRKHLTPGRCDAYAPCGNRCILERTIKHELHCCREPSCYCHSRERLEKVTK
jgi:hypothetical protein